MATSTGRVQWHANYWSEQKHGSAWERAKESLKRDWSQTKADVHLGSGRQLNQNVDDTVKQAVGREPIPPPDIPNPKDFDKVAPAISYGVAAREEYAQTFPDWDEKLEAKLAAEWDARETGMPFEEARPYVRRGWEYRK